MYRHTQIGWLTVFALTAGVAVLAVIYGTMGPNSPGRPGLLVAMVLLAALAPVFSMLTVTVDPETVTTVFGLGIIRKRIRIADIRSAERVRNRWWYGWGIRVIGSGGWMFNVSGLDAVEIGLKNGGRFRIGTDEPEELVNAIRGKM